MWLTVLSEERAGPCPLRSETGGMGEAQPWGPPEPFPSRDPRSPLPLLGDFLIEVGRGARDRKGVGERTSLPEVPNPSLFIPGLPHPIITPPPILYCNNTVL